MRKKSSAWRSRYPETATCVRCLEEKEVEDMDRLLWCADCRLSARRRASLWGWSFGAVFASVLAIWIWVYIQPSDVIIGGWIATVVAGLYLSSRVAREVAFGVMRFQNRKAAEATPPTP
jgi:hypothetical protein